MQPILLYWFAAQQQTSTLKLQKFGLFYVKFIAEFNELNVFFLKATGNGQKMNKTEVVWKIPNKCHSETKGYETTGQDSVGSPMRGFFHNFFDSFSLSNAKGLTRKAFLEVSLVSLAHRACTVF